MPPLNGWRRGCFLCIVQKRLYAMAVLDGRWRIAAVADCSRGRLLLFLNGNQHKEFLSELTLRNRLLETVIEGPLFQPLFSSVSLNGNQGSLH
jgi:hypothetical protein